MDIDESNFVNNEPIIPSKRFYLKYLKDENGEKIQQTGGISVLWLEKMNEDGVNPIDFIKTNIITDEKINKALFLIDVKVSQLHDLNICVEYTPQKDVNPYHCDIRLPETPYKSQIDCYRLFYNIMFPRFSNRRRKQLQDQVRNSFSWQESPTISQIRELKRP